MDPDVPFIPPDYLGGSLINLVAELEWRLTGAAPAARMHAGPASEIPEADTYVLLLMDGLGAHQLDHPSASSLAANSRGTIDAPFPTTTTVSLASIATGLPPRLHGLLGHVIWLPELGQTVNSLKWIGPGGAPIDVDTAAYLPAPNLWERLRTAGVEPITVQPGHFDRTPLSKALYRGCRFESIWDTDDFVRAVVDLSNVKHRFIFAYLPQVDFAAHLFGQASRQYADALRTVERCWDRIATGLGAEAVMVGTSDHGHLDYRHEDKHLIASADARGLTLFGDTRSLYVRGDPDRIEQLGAKLPARWVPLEDLRTWWGSSEPVGHPFSEREPQGVFMANEGRLLIPGHMDKRLIGYHGGLDRREIEVPLLVTQRS